MQIDSLKIFGTFETTNFFESKGFETDLQKAS